MGSEKLILGFSRRSLLIALTCAAVIFSGFLLFTGAAKQSISLDFDLEIADDATPSVLAGIMASENESIGLISFQKGTYHFYPEKAFETFRHISNHGDLLVRTAFPLDGMKDLIVNGKGSTFIFHGKMIPFLIDNGDNIQIKNVTIDWDVPFHSEMIVVATDAKNKTFDVEIPEQYLYEIRNDQLIFVKEYYEHSLGQTIVYDPERTAIAFNAEQITPLTSYGKTKFKELEKKLDYKYIIDQHAPEHRGKGRELILVAEEIKPGLVRIHNHNKEIPSVGLIITAKGEQGYNRFSPAIKITDTYNIQIENVTVHHAGGMGLIAENSGDIVVDNMKVVPSRARMVSTTADATHFVGCRGKITLKNCTFNNQLDDASNVHGTYQRIVDILSDTKIGVRMGHFQQQGFPIGIPNDTLGFVRIEDSFFHFDEITIKSIERINGRYHIIEINEVLPKSIQVGDLVENLSAYPEVLVENCTISNNRARGLLISTPKKTTIRNNFFSTEMEAILVPVESSHWYESGNAANVIIEKNTFQDCQHSGFDRGVIRFVTDDDNKNIAFNNIEIRNNTFNHFDNLILEIRNTKGLKFFNNTISNSGTFPMLNPQNPAIKIKNSQDVIFKNNKYSGKARKMIVSDSEEQKNIFN